MSGFEEGDGFVVFVGRDRDPFDPSVVIVLFLAGFLCPSGEAGQGTPRRGCAPALTRTSAPACVLTCGGVPACCRAPTGGGSGGSCPTCVCL